MSLTLDQIIQENGSWNWYAYCDLAEIAPDCWSPEQVQERLVARDWYVSMQSIIDACDNYEDRSWNGETPIKVRVSPASLLKEGEE